MEQLFTGNCFLFEEQAHNHHHSSRPVSVPRTPVWFGVFGSTLKGWFVQIIHCFTLANRLNGYMDSKHHQSQHQYGLSSWLDIDSALLLIIIFFLFCPVGNSFNLESHNQRFCFVLFLSQEHDMKNCPRCEMVRSTVQT